MDSQDLERVLKKQVEPIIEQTLHKYTGLTIKELNEDITTKLKKNPLLEFHIDISIPFKAAKKAFIKGYLENILKTNFGDVSATARICKVNRKTIHKLINDLRIDIKKCRAALLRFDYFTKEAIAEVVTETLESYKEKLHEKSLQQAYKSVDELSLNILKEYAPTFIPLKEAVKEFEKEYITQALKASNNNISQAARMIGLRFETLHRKMKELRL
ncbi:hypothetical protein HY501_01275 [Candidatus Woesearchaeota archaeon]|nr:hypothetical protein [Candidatus Woesearchaeota archaeon]